MARVRKHRRKWQVLFIDPDTKREKSAGVFTRKKDADSHKKHLDLALEVGDWIDPALRKTRFSDWADQWLRTRANLTPKTIEGYASLLRSRILPHFGHRELQHVRPIDVESWIAEMVAIGLSASRIQQAYHVLGSVFKSAVRNQMISNNPAEGVKLPEKPQREMLFLSGDEVDRLASAVPAHYGALVYTLAYEGIRVGEAIALRRNTINLLHGELAITGAATEVRGRLVFGETKNRAHRQLPIPPFLRRKLEDHLAAFVGPEPDSLVFTSDTGQPLRLSNFRERIWKPALGRADINPRLRIHDLRHTAASLMMSVGVQAKVVQEHLGHSSYVVTMDRYGHLYPEERIRLAAALEDLYQNRRSLGSG